VSKVVLVTQRIDPHHPNLGAAVSLVRAFARRVDEVAVVALSAVEVDLPANVRVHVVGSRSRVGRGVRFAWALLRELRPGRTTVVAHMSPIYAVLAAPVCRPLGIPVVLWFTHWRATAQLRLAARLATRIATVDAASFPIETDKVVSTGHGIELRDFRCRPATAGGQLRATALGRTSPSKDLERLAEGVRLARERGVDVSLAIRGPSETDEERRYRARLEQLGDAHVTVGDPVPRSQLDEVFAETDVLLNAAGLGALDKVVFEACASCVPVLATNPGFEPLLGRELLFPRGDVEALAERLAWFAGLDAGERGRLGAELRGRVERDHSVDAWAGRILAAAGR
jgi:glycosyltransferase involved in cell wall biosynthesis